MGLAQDLRATLESHEAAVEGLEADNERPCPKGPTDYLKDHGTWGK